MASRFAQRQLIIPNENFDVHPKKKANVDGKVNGLIKTVTKKGDRKALNDITNKSSNIRIEDTSTTKKNVPKKEELFDVAQEMFLHDHKKCIESQKQQSGMNSFYLDLVLPGHDSADLYSPCCYPEQVELPMADWLESSTDWTSPPCSPLHWDSPPSTPFAWESEVVEFVLKQEVDI
ncbi:protein PATRONUS 2 [Quercus suber]|uniref:protein PATRONUS 2 n=1 Tax=Quercus suber TaxID=58331 RepID=UPI0032DF230B